MDGEEPPGGVCVRLTAGDGPTMNGFKLAFAVAVDVIVCWGMLFEGETRLEVGADIDCDWEDNSWAPDVKLWDVVIDVWLVDSNLVADCSTGVVALLAPPEPNTGIESWPELQLNQK